MKILTINERFKEIRLNLNKTQADFGEQCGLGRAVIANIENNRSPVTPLYIKVVVDNFGVNEEWLIKGTGDMFLETKEQYIDRLAERYGLDDFMKKVITAYSELSDDEKKVVKDFIKKINEPDPDKKRLLLAGQGGSAEVEVKDPEGASNALKDLKAKHKK